MKLEKSDHEEVSYPSKKYIATLALGVALSTTACSTTKPKTPTPRTQEQIEPPALLGGIPPIAPPPKQRKPQTTTCDVNTSHPTIKHPTALAGKIVAPRR